MLGHKQRNKKKASKDKQNMHKKSSKGSIKVAHYKDKKVLYNTALSRKKSKPPTKLKDENGDFYKIERWTRYFTDINKCKTRNLGIGINDEEFSKR